MRRIAIAAIPLLAVLLMPGGANAAPARHALPAKCVPNTHTLLADPQAQVYSEKEEPELSNAVTLRGCVHGHRSFSLSLSFGLCYSGEERLGPIECIKDLHLTLSGTFIAYEYAVVSGGKNPEIEPSLAERYVVVRDLRTGRMLHKVPTGAPLKPGPGYAGVGNLVALVLKSDGSVAWVAEDYERTAAGPPVGQEGTRLSYFDVYACDKSGTRLLAAGTNVDPSSLALSTGATGISGYPSSIAGSTVSWTQGGVSASAVLN
jgi:hypothetical protein